jgi:hypothetical protein
VHGYGVGSHLRVTGNGPQLPHVLTARRKTLEATMADKLGPLTDRTPGDASKMGSNRFTSLYVGATLAIIGFVIVLYWVG